LGNGLKKQGTSGHNKSVKPLLSMSQGPSKTHCKDKPSPRYAWALVLTRFTMSFEVARF